MKKLFSVAALLLVLTLVLLWHVPPTHAAHSIALPSPPAASASCQINDAYPDASCTPGTVFATVTTDQACTPGYTTTVRHVPQSVKDEVYAEYGITSHSSWQYEIDHLIPLELAGSNALSNLWPEPAVPQPGFHEKDQVENYLHRQVCSGSMSLSDAEHAIASDWVAVYNQMPKDHFRWRREGNSFTGADPAVKNTLD
jgi:hypothetical protein